MDRWNKKIGLDEEETVIQVQQCSAMLVQHPLTSSSPISIWFFKTESNKMPRWVIFVLKLLFLKFHSHYLSFVRWLSHVTMVLDTILVCLLFFVLPFPIIFEFFAVILPFCVCAFLSFFLSFQKDEYVCLFVSFIHFPLLCFFFSLFLLFSLFVSFFCLTGTFVANIPSVKNSCGIQVSRILYSESQDGKGMLVQLFVAMTGPCCARFFCLF